MYKNSYLSYLIMYAFYYLSWALFSAFISVYLLDQGYLASEVSLVVSMSYLSSMIAQPLIGIISERYGTKKVNIILFVLCAAGGAFFAFADNLISIMIGYSFVLMLLNGTNPVMEKIATASPYRYGSIRIWGTIGYSAGSQLAGMIYAFVSPRSVFLGFIATMLMTVIGTLGTDPDLSDTTQKADRIPVSNLFRNRKYLYYLLISAIFYGASMMANTFIPSMFVSSGMQMEAVSVLLSIAVAFELPFVLFSHKFMDRISNRNLLLIAFTMICVQFGVYAFHTGIPLRIVITLISKHPSGMLFIMINLKVIHTIVEEEQIITAMSFAATMKNLSSIVSQNIAGRLLDVYSYEILFMIFFVVLLVGLVLTARYRIDDGNDLGLFGHNG